RKILALVLSISIPKADFPYYHADMNNQASPVPPSQLLTQAATRVPPHAWFGVSAIFHYLGPSFAVLLFPAVGVLGVAWFRIASAALIFAP
ncbi:hypothetical protein SB775_29755, partial [Peribacillus sp. SIMBA_075]|uniref:hypothetical protein n=1 Tax=Peribacillus sp. SIMBA_075 TaxID=3085813 RepID=UPI00397C8A45